MAGQWSAARTWTPWPCPHRPGSLRADAAWPWPWAEAPPGLAQRTAGGCKETGGRCLPRERPWFLQTTRAACGPVGTAVGKAPAGTRPPDTPRAGGGAQACEVRSLGDRASPSRSCPASPAMAHGPRRPPSRLRTRQRTVQLGQLRDPASGGHRGGGCGVAAVPRSRPLWGQGRARPCATSGGLSGAGRGGPGRRQAAGTRPSSIFRG